LPLLHDELGLKLRLAIRDRELDVLRTDALLERERGGPAVVASVRALAGEDRDELVLAGLDVADVQAMHAALDQGVGLARSVEVVRDFLAVELEADGVEREELADVHRDEDGHLRVRREQQLFLEQEEIAVQVGDELLQVLHALVERAEIARRGPRRARAEIRQRAVVLGARAGAERRRAEREPQADRRAGPASRPTLHRTSPLTLSTGPARARGTAARCRAH